MALKTSQIRYIKDGDPRNYPANLTAAMLTSGSFLDSATRITRLIVQGNFDLAFYLNDTITPIRIAPSNLNTGDHQRWDSNDITLPLSSTGKVITDISPIYSLRFDAKALKHFLDVNEQRLSPSGQLLENYLFINYTYETVS